MLYIVPGNVDVITGASIHPHTVVVTVATSREEEAMVVAMYRDVEHGRVWFKQVLCAVAMVNIPVEYQYSGEEHTISEVY